MSNERIVRRFHNEILTMARQKLGRPLTGKETAFVNSRRGLVALEMILDTVRADAAAEIERFLDSEWR